MSDDPLSPAVENPIELDTFALSTAIYAERDDKVLLLQRAEGSAMAGTFFLPGGIVDPGETPWQAAARELEEETGLTFAATPQMVGCYPMYVYGRDFLQLTFRGAVNGTLATSSEHTDHRWVDPNDWARRYDADTIDSIAGGNRKILTLLNGIRDDLDRYLALRPDNEA